MLHSLPLDATPPTVAMWTNVANYYIILGTVAGAIVVAFMVYSILKNRDRPGRQVPAYHEEAGDWAGWKGVVLLLTVTGSVLALVEYETFASANILSVPNDSNALHVTVTGFQYKWEFTYPNGYANFQNL